MQKLNPNCTYTFSEDDLKFVLELAKVGFVNLSSSQVVLVTRGSDKSINFKTHGGTQECLGLILPDNWVIEYISATDHGIHITFGVLKSKPKE